MLDDLITLEEAADRAVEALPLLQLPARAVLAGMHYTAFLGRNGRGFGGAVAPGQGEAIVTRLSHALPLLRRLSPEPYGEGAEDAIGAFREADPDGTQLQSFLTYLHFSEIMPEARRGRLVVERVGAGLRLSHPDEATAEAEARDVTLSEVALPFPLEEDGRIEPKFAEFARSAPTVDWKFIAIYVATNAYKYRHGLAEADLITEASIQHMFGFGRDRYLFIRSALLAFAEFCEKLAVTIHMGVMAGKLEEERLYEGMEWASVNLKAEFVHEFIAAAALATPEEVERFLSLYTLDYRVSPARDWGGDGFFPPFARFPEGYLFAPGLVLTFLQVRNAVYAFAKQDKKTFDDDVSHELEPVLLQQAAALLRRSGDWKVVEDVSFPGGQIDLFVGSTTDDAVLPIQAKGNLPPQGARLTDRLTGRIREGVRQIERFDRLGDDRQREVIERVLDRRVERIDVCQAVLARSCFGALEVLAADFPHLALTLPLLGLALERHRAAGAPTTVPALVATIRTTVAEVFERAGPHWVEGRIVVEGTELVLPLLHWKDGELDRLRREWWHSTLNT